MARSQKEKSWSQVYPKTKKARLQLLRGCGPQCFLQPYAKPYPKYPVCEKAMGHGKVCKRSCQGILAAYRRSKQNNRAPVIAKKALALAKKMRCGWYIKYHTKAGKKALKKRSAKRKGKKSQRKKKVARKGTKCGTRRIRLRKAHEKLSKVQLYKLAKKLKNKHGDDTPLSLKTRRGLMVYIDAMMQYGTTKRIYLKKRRTS